MVNARNVFFLDLCLKIIIDFLFNKGANDAQKCNTTHNLKNFTARN
jgi:hypothetical protein